MGRGRSSIIPSLIEDNKKRIQSFQNRRQGLEKKAYELSTLCEVDICMIIVGPEDNIKGCNNHPVVWPQDPNVARRMIELYENKHKIDKNSIRSADIVSVYEDRVRIVGKEVENLKKRMKIDDEYPVWDESYDLCSYDQLLMYGNDLDNMLVQVQSRIDSVKKNLMFHQEVPSYNNNDNNNQLNPFNCLGSDMALALHDSNKTMYESFNCFRNQGSVVRDDSQIRRMMMGEGSSSSNIYNYNNFVVPSNFDHMITNSNCHLQPPPRFVNNNFVQNNNNLVVDHQLQNQNQYLSYVPSQPQQTFLMPFPFSSIDGYSQSQMAHGEIEDAKIDQFGGNIF